MGRIRSITKKVFIVLAALLIILIVIAGYQQKNERMCQVKSEKIIKAPVEKIWGILTDINQLPKINTAVISVTGNINHVGGTRICEIENGKNIGTSTETIVSMENKRSIVWKVDSDNMGRSKILKGLNYTILLESVQTNEVKVTMETSYHPVNLFVRLLNILIIKRKISQAQDMILMNLSSLAQ